MHMGKPLNVALAWSGIAAAAVFIISLMAAVSLDGGWVLGENTLSDLGASATDARLAFNYGCCVLTAVLLAVFGFSSAAYAANRSTAVGGIVMIIAAALLVMVGLIAKDSGDGTAHNLVSYTFFLTAFIAVCLYASGFWLNGRKLFAGLVLAALIALVGVYLGHGLAMLEVWGVFAALACVVMAAADMMMTEPGAGICVKEL